MKEYFEQQYVGLLFEVLNEKTHVENGVSSIKKQWTNSESQCGKVIHKKSVGKAGSALTFRVRP